MSDKKIVDSRKIRPAQLDNTTVLVATVVAHFYPGQGQKLWFRMYQADGSPVDDDGIPQGNPIDDPEGKLLSQLFPVTLGRDCQEGTWLD